MNTVPKILTGNAIVWSCFGFIYGIHKSDVDIARTCREKDYECKVCTRIGTTLAHTLIGGFISVFPPVWPDAVRAFKMTVIGE